jgi:hypothetical protein
MNSKEVRMHIECANLDNFVKIVKKKPTVLHIMCHGSFDQTTQEFYLEFENTKGEMLKLTSSELKKHFRDEDLSEIKVVFINACHSQHISKAFIELGVGSVVVVKDQLKIHDAIASRFPPKFYGPLLEGKSVWHSFNEALRLTQSNDYAENYTCCCGHAHESDCKWLRFVEKNGAKIAHWEHEPTCDCPNRKKHLHRDCAWAREFLGKYCGLSDQSFGDDGSGDERERLVCCCHPELDHNES